jgi:hypothetical protein
MKRESCVNDDFICPVPMKWSDVYTSLLEVWRKDGSKSDDKPPVPLILAAWWYTPLLAKKVRWLETIEWARQHGCLELIPALTEEEKFRG